MIEDELWDRVAAGWPALLEQARAAVSEERWASRRARWERPEPLLEERDGDRPVQRASKKAPADVSRAVRYGYDSDGRLVVADRFRGATTADASYAFAWVELERGATVLIEVAAEYEGEAASLVSLTRPRYDGERLVGVDTRWIGRETLQIEERYDYDPDGRLVRILEREEGDEGVTETDYDVSYDDDRLAMIACVVREPGEEPRTVIAYRDAEGTTVAQATKVVEDRLPERVAAWAARVAPSEPVAALALLYSYDFPGLPPALAILTEHERALLASRPRKDDEPAEVWSPAEWNLLDADAAELSRDGELAAASQMLVQRWTESDATEPLRRLLVKSAKALSERDWPSLDLSLGELVVFAVDGEQQDLTRNLKATTTAVQRSRMEK